MNESIFPIIEALFSLIIFITSFILYKKTKDKFIRNWAIAFFLYSIGYIISIVLLLNIVQFTSKTHFIIIQYTRQTLINLFFIIIIYSLFEKNTTKYELKRKIPLIIFIFAQGMLLYFDITSRGTIGETLHIIILDIPFNLTIGSLFFKQYFEEKDIFSMINGIAWYLYVISVVINQNIFVLSEYKYMIYLFSEIHIILIAISMFYIYKNERDNKILREIDIFSENVIKDMNFFLEKYSVKYGDVIFFNEVSNKKYELMNEFSKQDIPILIITRQNPDFLLSKEKIKQNAEIYWLTKIKTHYKTLDPNNLENIILVIKDFINKSIQKNSNGILFIDGIEYLILNNSFNKILHTVQLIKDTNYGSKAVVIIPLAKATLTDQEYDFFRSEFIIKEY